MNKGKFTEKKTVSLSYIDLVFLILVGLVLSFFIYAAADSRGEEKAIVQYRVELSAVVPGEFSQWVPREGEELYNKAGERIGEVTVVSLSPVFEGNQVNLICLLDQKPPAIGEEYEVESARSVLTMTVLSVTDEVREEVYEREKNHE